MYGDHKQCAARMQSTSAHSILHVASSAQPACNSQARTARAPQPEPSQHMNHKPTCNPQAAEPLCTPQAVRQHADQQTSTASIYSPRGAQSTHSNGRNSNKRCRAQEVRSQNNKRKPGAKIRRRLQGAEHVLRPQARTASTASMCAQCTHITSSAQETYTTCCAQQRHLHLERR
jgi:hypothetical protein